MLWVSSLSSSISDGASAMARNCCMTGSTSFFPCALISILISMLRSATRELSGKPLILRHHSHLRAVLTELGQFLALEPGEGDGGVVLRHDVLRVKDVEQLIAFQAI